LHYNRKQIKGANKLQADDIAKSSCLSKKIDIDCQSHINQSHGQVNKK